MRPYQVIEVNPTKPVLVIEQIKYAEIPYTQYTITGWGGSATPVNNDEHFCTALGKSIKYVKQHCENRGNLG